MEAIIRRPRLNVITTAHIGVGERSHSTGEVLRKEAIQMTAAIARGLDKHETAWVKFPGESKCEVYYSPAVAG